MVILVRHGETEWSRDLLHTSHTDIPLTGKGREHALLAGRRLATREWALVLTSPLGRAHETARLAGLGDKAEPTDDLLEWDYGDYEGRSTDDVRRERPGWDVWKHGVTGGETVEEVGVRVDRVIDRVLAADGDVAVFGHGHALRIFGARWATLPPACGSILGLHTASLCELGFERERRVIHVWNDTGHLQTTSV